MMRAGTHIRAFGILVLTFIIYCLLGGVSDAKHFAPLPETHIQASVQDYCRSASIINDESGEEFAQEHVQPNHIDGDLLLERTPARRLVGFPAPSLQSHAPPTGGSWPIRQYATGPPGPAIRNAA
ncbi:hypothetical protein [Microvirga pudoricolor]|uniref:hypothetical protein n=1 Tax=Microvirga pudoricolor TaxID=2778729 RepID=UPI0019504A57|nr:hypothetical protein [Microvirga pudoricolor]MBM6596353.1 hypothetical protein [Microvirga pudoricolor]